MVLNPSNRVIYPISNPECAIQHNSTIDVAITGEAVPAFPFRFKVSCFRNDDGVQLQSVFNGFPVDFFPCSCAVIVSTELIAAIVVIDHHVALCQIKVGHLLIVADHIYLLPCKNCHLVGEGSTIRLTHGLGTVYRDTFTGFRERTLHLPFQMIQADTICCGIRQIAVFLEMIDCKDTSDCNDRQQHQTDIRKGGLQPSSLFAPDCQNCHDCKESYRCAQTVAEQVVHITNTPLQGQLRQLDRKGCTKACWDGHIPLSELFPHQWQQESQGHKHRNIQQYIGPVLG